MGDERSNLPQPKVPLLPTVYLPNATGTLEAVVDTTPIIRQLESLSPTRSVIPSNPVLAFLNYVLEDYADEWLTRCMFHYRWHFDADIEKAGRILPLFVRVDQSPETLQEQAEEFTRRQVDRLHVVGSNETTAPVIEASYQRLLHLFESHLKGHPFLFGNRPSSADFAMMGQLTCLTHFDPTPMRLCESLAPRVYAWVERLEDLSGYEVTEQDRLTPAGSLPSTLLALLSEVARTHMPQLIANGRASIGQKEAFTTEIDGRAWLQPTFPYQFKCLRWTRKEFQSLSTSDKAAVRSVLETTGLVPLIDEIIDVD